MKDQLTKSNALLINTLRERLRGPYVHPDISAEPNRHRAILAAVAMAATGGVAVCVLPDIIACHYAAKKATLFCTLADIEYSELRDGAGVILRIPGRQPQDGRIVFAPSWTNHLKFKGAEITGVWVEAEHGDESNDRTNRDMAAEIEVRERRITDLEEELEEAWMPK